MIKLLTSFLSGDKAILLHLYEGILAWLLSWEVNAHVVHWFVPPVALEENGSTQPNVTEEGKFPSQWPLCSLRSGCLGEKKDLNSCVPWSKSRTWQLKRGCSGLHPIAGGNKQYSTAMGQPVFGIDQGPSKRMRQKQRRTNI